MCNAEGTSVSTYDVLVRASVGCRAKWHDGSAGARLVPAALESCWGEGASRRLSATQAIPFYLHLSQSKAWRHNPCRSLRCPNLPRTNRETRWWLLPPVRSHLATPAGSVQFATPGNWAMMPAWVPTAPGGHRRRAVDVAPRDTLRAQPYGSARSGVGTWSRFSNSRPRRKVSRAFVRVAIQGW